MSLASQGLFINDVVVRMGCQFFYELFSRGRLVQWGVIVDFDGKRSGPINVDPALWRRYGFAHDAQASASG